MHESLGKTGTIILDAGSGSTFLFGAATGQIFLMIVGGLASIAAIINHTDAYLQRRKEKK